MGLITDNEGQAPRNFATGDGLPGRFLKAPDRAQLIQNRFPFFVKAVNLNVASKFIDKVTNQPQQQIVFAAVLASGGDTWKIALRRIPFRDHIFKLIAQDIAQKGGENGPGSGPYVLEFNGSKDGRGQLVLADYNPQTAQPAAWQPFGAATFGQPQQPAPAAPAASQPPAMGQQTRSEYVQPAQPAAPVTVAAPPSPSMSQPNGTGTATCPVCKQVASGPVTEWDGDRYIPHKCPKTGAPTMLAVA
jgi:hypothetical protein